MIHTQSRDILTAQVIHSPLFRVGECFICLHDLHIKKGEKKDIHVSILVFLGRVLQLVRVHCESKLHMKKGELSSLGSTPS